ncbi:MAG: helix-turn-helix domain-containing protein [Clostridia bacterium]|nr:helix-turn-helix domain-containing protein [Clostridia bacterium]
MNIISAHITRLRISSGISQEQLAQRIGTGVTTVKNIESGYLTSPPTIIVEKLSEVFGVTPFELMNCISFCVGEKGRMVHVVSAVSGDKPFLETAKIVETIFIDGDRYDGNEYMGVKMPDNAMIDAHICPDDSVIVRQDAVIKNGDMVLAVYSCEDGVVRRYYKKGNMILLKAENTSGLYPDIEVDAESDRFKILGKVITSVRSY